MGGVDHTVQRPDRLSNFTTMVCSQNRHFPTTDLRLAVSSTAGILSKQLEPWCPMWYSWVIQQSTRSMGAPEISIAPETLRHCAPRCAAYRPARRLTGSGPPGSLWVLRPRRPWRAGIMHGSQPPRRMRYSVEPRLGVVRLIEAGMAPA